MIRKLEDKDIDTVMSIWKYSTIKAHNFIDKKLNLAVYKDNKKSVEFYLNKGFDIIIEQVNEDFGFKEYIMEIKI